jgi:hypothetical protein
MKKLFILMISAAIFSSCEKIVGEGPVVTETRHEPPFQGLSVSVPAEAYFTQSPGYNITLEAQQNILDEIETIVQDNVLKIRFRHPGVRIRNSEKIIVRVTGPEARVLEMNGSGSLQVDGTINPATLNLYVSGSGNIDVDDIQSNTIKTIISGSGRIGVNSGSANEEEITISGSGFIDMSEVVVKDADTRISGSGTMEVYTTHTLKAKISGSGTVYYKGNPTISSQISGSGSVVRL